MQFEHTQTLVKAGLSESQALVYEALLHLGEQRVGSLTHSLPLKRQLVYKVLDDLVAFGLVEKREKPGAVARFLPKHPAHLRELVEGRMKALQESEQVLQGLLPTLSSTFNLTSGQPGVLVYEGKEAIEKVLADSLTSRTDIYSYIDPRAVDAYFAEANKKYLRRRKEEFLMKHLLVVKSPYIEGRYTKEKYPFTEVRTIEKAPNALQVALQIYDGKVSYLTLLPDRIIGVIIDDPNIFSLQKFLFLRLYESCEVVLSAPSLASTEGRELADEVA